MRTTASVAGFVLACAVSAAIPTQCDPGHIVAEVRGRLRGHVGETEDAGVLRFKLSEAVGDRGQGRTYVL